MSIAAPELTDPESGDQPILVMDDDALLVVCAVCDTRQYASGRALGYTCSTCGSAWTVLRCRDCRKASIVLEGVHACPGCGHDHRTRVDTDATRASSWLTEPNPLSVWLGGVKYLGGHADRDQPVGTAGLLLDRRGIHLRAFAELFSIRWDRVLGLDIEGSADISERLTLSRLRALGATTWAISVSYLTVHTTDGDAVFEVDSLNPPALHARLSRVLQGLQQSERPPEPIAIGRGPSDAPVDAVPEDALPEDAVPVHAAPAPLPVAPAPPPVAPPDSGLALRVDPAAPDTPPEVLIIDALWKLARLREVGLVSDVEVEALRARLLARLPDLSAPAADPGPLLHV